MKPEIETRNTVVLSMQHLRCATVDKLRLQPLDHWPFMGAPVGPDMILAYCHTENGGNPGIPDDVWACIFWARNSMRAGMKTPGFDYILFDRDKDPEEDGSGLPIYGADPEHDAMMDRAAFLKLWEDADALDAQINSAERPPTAEDYNRLLALVQRSKRPA